MWRPTSTAPGGRTPLPGSSGTVPAVADEGPPGARPGGATVEVPDLVGMDTQDARRVARYAELGLALEERPTESGLQGRVFRQEPEAGTLVPTGEVVVVTVGARPEAVVPDVRGLDEQEALARLRAAGLSPARRAVRRSKSVPKGHVVRTRPRTGSSVPLGTRITYVVATEPRPRHAAARREAGRDRVQRMPDGSFLTLPEDD